jgi:iron complex outermembrane receptor protein
MNKFRSERLGYASVAAILAVLTAPSAVLAQAATYNFDIPSQDLGAALRAFGREAHQQISFNGAAVSGKQSPALSGAYSADDALRQLLTGSGLDYRLAPSGVWIVGPTGAAGGATETTAPPPAGSPTATVEAVVVTGTNIRGGVTASPVTTFDRKAIEQSGYIDTESFINALPQNWGGTANSASVATHVDTRSDALAGENGANLHGLGPTATLTLIDGHRMAPADFGSFTDLNAIPLTAVERVDVLTDGASALYGSDAVAGVINFVLRKRLDGAETVADKGGVTKGGMKQDHFAQTLGLDWAGGSGIVSYSYNDATALRAYSRAFTPANFMNNDLTPRQFTRSLFAHATQAVNNKLDVYATGLATHRNDSDNSGYFGNLQTDADEVMAMAGGRYQFNRRWDIDLSLSTSGYHQRRHEWNKTVLVQDATSNYETTSGEALINGRILTLPAGDLKTALGGELRRETYGDRGNRTGSGAPNHGVRNVSAAFAEVDVPIFSSANARPLLQELTLSAAGRWEHYSDFGSTANPKVGLRWKPDHQLLLRATDGTSFNAPTLREETSFSESVPFPVVDPLSSTGMSNALILAGINTHLRPETSRTKTIGGDYEPDWAKGLKVSLTWFETRYSNRITTPPGNPFAALVNSGLYASEITRNPTLAQINAAIAGTTLFINPFGIPLNSIKSIINAEEQNLASEDMKGWDFSAAYSHSLWSGNLTLNVSGEHLDSFKVALTPTATPTDVSNTAYNPPAWRTRSSASWAWREWTFTGTLNTVGSYTDNLTLTPSRVKAYSTIDGQMSYRVNSNMQPFSGMTLALSVIDLFDTQPPFVAGAQAGYDPTNASPLGRVWTVSLRKRW